MATMADLRVQADRKRLSDLLAKHSSGKISKGEYAELQSLIDENREREAMAAGADPSDKVWLVGNRELAGLFDVSQKTICAWVKVGMPKLDRDRYDFRRVFPWWSENINRGPEDQDETITAAKKQYWLEKVENLRIKNEALRGEYVRQEQIIAYNADAVARFRNGLRSLRTRLPPILAGKTTEEMLPIIEHEIDQALRDLIAALRSETGGKRPTKKRKTPAKKIPKKAGKK